MGRSFAAFVAALLGMTAIAGEIPARAQAVPGGARIDTGAHPAPDLGEGRHDVEQNDRRSDGTFSGERGRYRHDGTRRSSLSSLSRPISGRSRSFHHRRTGVYANAVGPTIVVIQRNGKIERADHRYYSEPAPKIIDVAAARLDHQPIGPSGLSVHRVGVAKIIRIAPGYRLGDTTAADRRPAVREAARQPTPKALPRPYQPPRAALPDDVPVPLPAPDRAVPQAAEPATEAAAAPAASVAPVEALEPWTDEWLRDCVARHETFDASLGTYIDEAGRRRFCTGERS